MNGDKSFTVTSFSEPETVATRCDCDMQLLALSHSRIYKEGQVTHVGGSGDEWKVNNAVGKEAGYK